MLTRAAEVAWEKTAVLDVGTWPALPWSLNLIWLLWHLLTSRLDSISKDYSDDALLLAATPRSPVQA